MDVRYCSRLMIVNEQDELLLFQYKDEYKPTPFWATVGGELKGDETYLDAAKRELYEETGLKNEIGELIFEREDVFAVARSVPAIWKEKYYLVKCSSNSNIYATEWTEEEKSTIQKWKWWSLETMKREPVGTFLPACIPDLLVKIMSNSSAA